MPEEAAQPPQSRLPASPPKRSLVPHLYLPPPPGAAAPVAGGGPSLHARPVWSANTLFDADQEGEEDAPLSGGCPCLAWTPRIQLGQRCSAALELQHAVSAKHPEASPHVRGMQEGMLWLLLMGLGTS